MAQLVALVVHDPGQVDAVVHAWLEAGVNGMTLLDSSGLSHHEGEHHLRDDVPLFPSVRSLLRSDETSSRMIFSLVADDFDIDRLIAASEAVIGSLDGDEVGVLFVVPVSRVVGAKGNLPGEDLK